MSIDAATIITSGGQPSEEGAPLQGGLEQKRDYTVDGEEIGNNLAVDRERKRSSYRRRSSSRRYSAGRERLSLQQISAMSSVAKKRHSSGESPLQGNGSIDIESDSSTSSGSSFSSCISDNSVNYPKNDP